MLDESSISEDSSLQKLSKHHVRFPESMGKIDLLYDRENTQFFVSSDNEIKAVSRHSMDDLLFNVIKQDRIDRSALSILLSKAYIKTIKLSDGNFKLQSCIRGPGGGPTGAIVGAYTGKLLVSVAGHGALALIASLSGPAAPGVMIGLEATFGLTIEAASVHTAFLLGFAGMVATGPV